jgi:pimeloyl-ACP methyl ester carboxylesterase
MAEVEQHSAEIDGEPVSWRSAPGSGTPTLFVHGVPNSSPTWEVFLERIGGVAIDLPGFGRSCKAANVDYSIRGYDRHLERFLDLVELERVNLVMHDWGAAALAFAERCPERVQRIVLINALPLLPGFRWRGVERAWRTPVIGELVMGSLTPRVARRLARGAGVTAGPAFDRELAQIAEQFDFGTQRAILKLLRSADPDTLAGAGIGLRELSAPALVVWGERDQFIPARFAQDYARALGGSVEVLMLPDAGHWPWLDRPDVVTAVAEFVRAR